MYTTSLQLLCLLCFAHVAQGQEADGSCYGAGSIALSVVLTLILGFLLAGLVFFLYSKYWKARKGQHLILETDPEKGKGEYAFDNPGFRDAGLSPVGKSAEKSGAKLETNLKTKWNQWSPLGVLTAKNEKKRTLDDSELEHQVKHVSLRSHDFTGLGFNICGNMKDGIFIKDILHRGPASESKKLNAGDRIQSVTISFEHMVYEDALAILSYASPYEIIVSAKNGKAFNYSGQVGRPLHPIYRSSSNMELNQMEKSAKKRLFDDSSDFGSNYSSLQKNHNSMVPTLERSRSKSPKPVMKTTQKTKVDQHHIEYKEHLRPKVPRKIETEVQNTENKVHKFGIQVLPPLESPTKSAETQNVNNINHENELVAPIMSIDEVDKSKKKDQLQYENENRQQRQQQAPPVKKREKLQLQQQAQQKQEIEIKPEEDVFQRHNSGIKRDENNIPLEIPSTMMNAAVAARKNRKSMEEEELKSPNKKKGKAPAPPEANQENKTDALKGDLKGYNSDSDVETDNQSSVNTIELNASDITIHQSEESDEKQNRKTASTGDLSKIQKTRKTSTGTLERAQSLDITDTGMPVMAAKKRKAGKIDDFESKTSSDESLYGSSLVNKEPRLSLILDGLNTFQRSRLKKSTEWGNLEDAILSLDKQGSNESTPQNSSEEEFKISNENFNKNFNFGAKSPEFDALVNKINEIKQETMDIINEQDKHIKEVEISKKEVSHIIENVNNGIEPAANENEVSLKIEDEPMPEIIRNVEEFDDSPIVTATKRVKNVIWPFQNKDAESEEVHIEIINDIKPEEEVKSMKTAIMTDITPTSGKSTPISITQVSKPIIKEKIEVNSPNTLSTRSDQEPIKINEPKIVNVNEKDKTPVVNLLEVSDFLQAERNASSKYIPELDKHEDTNIPDDIKVSRHTFGSLEMPKNDKNVKNVHVTNVSNITINHQNKYENVNDKAEEGMYKSVSITTPDLIKNLTIAEAIHDVNNEVTIDGPTSLTLEISNAGATSDDNKIEIKQQNGIQMKPNGDINKLEVAAPDENEDNRHSSLTYITEIQVTTPQKVEAIDDIPEIDIVPKIDDKLDNDFEQYIKKFESNIKTFESNINNFEANIQSITETINTPTTIESPTNNVVTTTVTTVNEVVCVDPEKELQKVNEIVEEQLKKLPEMRFTTSSYESQIKPPEKRMSQIEILRSNFEKSNSPPRHVRSETSPPKSRIPVLNKTPPTSPERRDSRADNEQDTKEILEMVSSKYPNKNKNVTVTSIRNNSRIPSGLPTYGNKPPVPPKKSDSVDDIVHVSSNGSSGNVESFRQWVFNPNDQSITNISVTESKYDSGVHK